MEEAADTVPVRGVQQHLGSHHIGADERTGPLDRPVHVRLGGEMHHRVLARHHLVDDVRVTDVAPDEGVARMYRHRCQIGLDPRVGEFVEDGDPR